MKSKYLPRFLIILLLFALLPIAPAQSLEVTVAEPAVNRISGANRYGTAVAISQEGWETADTVVLARGDDYADALAGVPLAYALDAPMLLTHKDRLTESTKDEILRLKAKKAYILGGTGAVSEVVEDAVKAMGLDVVRISGANRFGTAAAVAKELAKYNIPTTAVMAYGLDFPDALAAASYAAVNGYPILLVRSDALTSATETVIAELNIDDFIVVGGPGVISDSLFHQLQNATRVAGGNRYETAIELAKYFYSDNERVYLATGLDFADAITGGVLAAKNNSAMLLVRKDRIPPSVQDFISGYRFYTASIFGGEGAINDTVIAETEDLVGYPQFTISGMVTNSDGTPIAGAIVFAEADFSYGWGDSEWDDTWYEFPVYEKGTVTDGSGYFTLSIPTDLDGELIHSGYTFNVQANGYYCQSQSFDFDEEEILSRLDCELTHPVGELYAVKGTVFDTDMVLPVQNINVRAYRSTGMTTGDWDIYYSDSVMTDINGDYVVYLPLGEYYFSVNSQYNINRNNQFLSEGDWVEIEEDIQTLDWMVTPLYEISGKVTYGDGTPAADAIIYAYEANSNYDMGQEYVGFADENGEYSMLLPAQDTYFFVSDGFFEEDDIFDCSYAHDSYPIDGSICINWTLNPMEKFTVSGRVLDINDDPVINTELEMDHCFFILVGDSSLVTDSNGYYSVELAAGRYSFWYNDYSLRYGDIVVCEDMSLDLCWDLGELFTVNGRITDTQGVPLSGVELSFYAPDFPFEVTVTTNETGDYSAQLYPGKYRVSGYKDGYDSLFYNQTIEEAQTLNFEMEELFEIQGIVTINGVPMGDVEVIASNERYLDYSYTDSSGNYALSLPAGTYGFKVWVNDVYYSLANPVVVTKNATVDIDINN